MNHDKLQELRIEPSAKRRPKGTVWLIFLGVVVLTGLAVFYAWPRLSDQYRVMGDRKAGSASATTGSAPVRTDAAPAAASLDRTPVSTPGKGAGEDSILTVSGYIINRERIELSPRFLGVVKWIGVKKGDAVTNGQVVVLLDDAEYQARLKEIEARLEHARVAVARSELDLKRAKELVRQQVEMQKVLDDAELQLAASQATVKEIEGQLALIRTYLDWTVIRSPINGVVLEKMVDPNELVVPQSFGGTRGPSTALISVADPKDLQVEIDLNESDVSKVFLNQRCRVSPEAYLERAYEGYVAEIAPEASRQKGTLQIKVQIRDPDRYLTPELSAKVDFLGPAGGETVSGK